MPALVIASALLSMVGQGEQPKTFDVISVKPCAKDERYFYHRLPGGGLSASVSLKVLLVEAYGVQPAQFKGGPKWVDEDCWTIQATAEGVKEQLSIAQQAPMVRALLEERFQLRIRRETKEMPVLALVVAKSGPKIKPHPPDSTEVEMRALQGSWSLKNVDLASVVNRLSRQLGKTVIDRTNLKGKYDLRLEWARDDADDSHASIFTAIQEQLGLKLESAVGPVEILVVDHVDRPAAN